MPKPDTILTCAGREAQKSKKMSYSIGMVSFVLFIECVIKNKKHAHTKFQMKGFFVIGTEMTVENFGRHLLFSIWLLVIGRSNEKNITPDIFCKDKSP